MTNSASYLTGVPPETHIVLGDCNATTDIDTVGCELSDSSCLSGARDNNSSHSELWKLQKVEKGRFLVSPTRVPLVYYCYSKLDFI